MQPGQINPSATHEEAKFPVADTGNASNPAPHNEAPEPPENQLLDKQAEKYLREAGNIEDLPDAQDQQEMDDTIEDEKEA